MSWLSNMRGPRLKTPLLLLLLLLLSSLTGKAFSQDEGEEAIIKSTEEPQETEPPTPTPDENQDGGTTQTSPTSTSSQTEAVEDDTGSGSGNPAGDLGQEEKGLDLLLLLIPAILAVVLIVAIVCGAVIIKRQCNKNSTSQEESKEDPYLDGSSTEKVPMPMFEEDVPSVLELEMDELDKWMQKDF